jgi:hypothetical protein
MPSEVAPIALFAFNRPSHLQQTLMALAECSQAQDSDLTIFCDGPRSEQDMSSVEQVRGIARTWADSGALGHVTIIEQPTNLGLATSVISGVTTILSESDTVIVLEDDIVVSPDFLRYMNDALALYHDEPAVVSIHGFTMNVARPLPQTFFLRGADCWGWATWRRGWEIFEPDAQLLLDQLDRSGGVTDFDFGDAYPYRDMLERQVKGNVDSWAVRWYASAYLANKLTLYPGKSLVRNIGQEGSGTHSMERVSHSVLEERFEFPLQKIIPLESAEAREAFQEALAKDQEPRWRVVLRHLKPSW